MLGTGNVSRQLFVGSLPFHGIQWTKRKVKHSETDDEPKNQTLQQFVDSSKKPVKIALKYYSTFPYVITLWRTRVGTVMQIWLRNAKVFSKKTFDNLASL